jgi:hypothetical protein
MRKVVSSVLQMIAILLLSLLVSGAAAERRSAGSPTTPGAGRVEMGGRTRTPLAPISEPGSILLLGSGLIGLAHFVRRGAPPK